MAADKSPRNGGVAQKADPRGERVLEERIEGRAAISESLKVSTTHPLDGMSQPGLQWSQREPFGGDRSSAEKLIALPDVNRLRAALARTGADEMDALGQRLLAAHPEVGCLAGALEFLLHALLPFPRVIVSPSEVALVYLCAERGPALAGGELGESVPVLAWDGSGSGLLANLDFIEAAATPEEAGLCLCEGFGLVAWGPAAQACEKLIRKAEAKLDAALEQHQRLVHEEPAFGLITSRPLPAAERRALAVRLGPLLRGRVAGGTHCVGRYVDRDLILNCLKRSRLRELLLTGSASLQHATANAHAADWLELAGQTDAELEGVVETFSASVEGAEAAPARRTVWVPGLGAFVFAENAQMLEQRLAAQASQLRIMAAAESLGGYRGWVGGRQLGGISHASATKQPLLGRIALVTGGMGGIGAATAKRLRREGACIVVADRAIESAKEFLAEAAETEPEYYQFIATDLGIEEQVAQMAEAVALHWCGLDILVNNAGLSIGKPVFETTLEDYDLLNTVMPRGSFLCGREAARIMRAQGLGGDIVYIASKNALYAGPNNVAYGTAKAAQLHQARLLAVELAEFQIRVNVVNPDAVVRGSGIFSQGWGADRARAYGIQEGELGKFYASRSLLKLEMFPEDIAAAVAVLVGPELRKSTGLVINVDSGFAPAMVR